MRDQWSTGRDRALRRLFDDLKRGVVDSEIAEWLYTFNVRQERIYTSSSCSGRVVVFYGKEIFNKRHARSLCECHYPETCKRYLCPSVLEVSSLIGNLNLVSWASLQPPIIHFIAKDLDDAQRVIECANYSGFTHSGFRRYRTGGYIVEVRAFDKLHVILPADCNKLLMLCEILREYKRRLSRFLKCVDENF